MAISKSMGFIARWKHFRQNKDWDIFDLIFVFTGKY